MEFDLGSVMLTSISSYTERDIVVRRDATQLSGSVTFDIGGGAATSAQVRTNSRLDDYTTVEVFTQELRLASDYEGRFQWVLGGFYSDIERNYGQTLPTPGYDDIMVDLICGGPPNCGVTSPDLGSPVDTPFFSRIPYQFEQLAVFAEGSFDITERLSATLGARWYDFSEDRNLYFGGLFADSDGLPTEPTNGPGSAEDDGILPRVLFAYDVSENVHLNV